MGVILRRLGHSLTTRGSFSDDYWGLFSDDWGSFSDDYWGLFSDDWGHSLTTGGHSLTTGGHYLTTWGQFIDDRGVILRRLGVILCQIAFALASSTRKEGRSLCMLALKARVED